MELTPFKALVIVIAVIIGLLVSFAFGSITGMNYQIDNPRPGDIKYSILSLPFCGEDARIVTFEQGFWVRDSTDGSTLICQNYYRKPYLTSPVHLTKGGIV